MDRFLCAVADCMRFRESEDTLMCSDHRKEAADRAKTMDPAKLERYIMRGQYREFPTPNIFIADSYNGNFFPDGTRRFGILEGFHHFEVRRDEYERFKAKYDARKEKERG